MSGDIFLKVAVIAIMIVGYFLPVIIGRNRLDRDRLFWLNFLLGWTIIGWVVALIWSLRDEETAPTHLCTACGSQVRPRTATRGSFGIELILWLCFLIPGLIYSIWRLSNRYYACPVCRSPSIIPLGTPAANAILARCE